MKVIRFGACTEFKSVRRIADVCVLPDALIAKTFSQETRQLNRECGGTPHEISSTPWRAADHGRKKVGICPEFQSVRDCMLCILPDARLQKHLCRGTSI